jgi:hypothetical protein
MAKLYNLARMSTATTGTGTVTLGSAVPPFLTFAQAGVLDGETVTYSIIDGTSNSEIGRGVYSSSGTTLTRSVLKSTNGNNAINLSGAAQVFITAATEDILSFSADQNRTAAEQAQARKNLYAAPFDAVASSGMQVNGGMDISQQNGAAAVTLTSGAESYIVDQWAAKFARVATLACSAQQVASPTPPDGFTSALQLKATTGLATLAAADYAYLSTPIEGHRAARCALGGVNAQPISIGFWVYTTIAGTMSVSLVNAAGNRGYVTNVTINSAATWEYKTVTIPGDTTGTWDKTIGVGVRIIFGFGCGSANQGSPVNSWLSAMPLGTSSTTNFMASTNNICCITGVLILPGIEFPSSSRSALIMPERFADQFAAQRYYHQWASINCLCSYSDATPTAYFVPLILVPRMRVLPNGVINVGGTTTIGRRDGAASYTFAALTINAADSENWTNCVATGMSAQPTKNDMHYLTFIAANARM